MHDLDVVHELVMLLGHKDSTVQGHAQDKGPDALPGHNVRVEGVRAAPRCCCRRRRHGTTDDDDDRVTPRERREREREREKESEEREREQTALGEKRDVPVCACERD